MRPGWWRSPPHAASVSGTPSRDCRQRSPHQPPLPARRPPARPAPAVRTPCVRTSPAGRRGYAAGCDRGHAASTPPPRSTAPPRRCRLSAPGGVAGPWLGPAEPISDSAHGLDDIGTEVLAQVSVVHVERGAADILVETAQGDLQLFTGKDRKSEVMGKMGTVR